jgi:hypothetical protein
MAAVPTVDTDEQQLTLVGNILTLEDGGTVDLTPYLDDTDTDDQQIMDFSIGADNMLTITLEDGGTQMVDLSGFISAPGSDDQQLSLISGTILQLEDGGFVSLTSFLDNTDDQQIEGFSLGADNVLNITLEDGGAGNVDLSGLLSDPETVTTFVNNQDSTFTYTSEDGTNTVLDLTPFVSPPDIDTIYHIDLSGDPTGILTITETVGETFKTYSLGIDKDSLAACLPQLPITQDDYHTAEVGVTLSFDVCTNDDGIDSEVSEVIFKGGNTGTGVFDNTGCSVTYQAMSPETDIQPYCVVTADGDTSNVSNIVIDVDVESDLQITKNLIDPNFFVNDTIQFELIAQNNGPADEPMAIVFDELSSNINFLSATCPYDPNTGLWIIGPLANGASVTCTLDVVTLSPDVYNNAILDGQNSDDNAINNVDIVSFFSPPAPEARVFMNNPDAETGVFDATFDFTQLSSGVPIGECVTIDVILVDTLTGDEYVWETITGLTGDDISTFTSTETTPNFSITDHSTGVVSHASITMTDKQAWAVVSGNNGANASRMTFRVTIGGTCAGNMTSILPKSVNVDNESETCMIQSYGFENQQLLTNIVSDDGVTITFAPLGDLLGYAYESSCGKSNAGANPIDPIPCSLETWRGNPNCDINADGFNDAMQPQGAGDLWTICEITLDGVIFNTNYDIVSSDGIIPPNGITPTAIVIGLSQFPQISDLFIRNNNFGLVNCEDRIVTSSEILSCNPNLEAFTMCQSDGRFIKYIIRQTSFNNY